MKKILTLVISVTALGVQAQIDSCNAFLQGNYVEVGVSPFGAYGTSSTQPAGYHGNSDHSPVNPCGMPSISTGLGFVADIDKDGWATGTPAYFGDYFLPGDPFEGWELQIGSGRVQAFNSADTGFVGTLAGMASGSNISYSDSGGIVTSTWQGTVDSIGITQVTTVDTGGLYFTMQITLTNYSSSPVNDIYYLRSLDPDNEEVETGDYSTNNIILYQSADTTLVTAAGEMYSRDILGLGTTDSNSRCLIYGWWPIQDTTDLATLYNETYTSPGGGPAPIYTPGDSLYDDYAIGLVHYIAHLASVDSATDSVGRTTSGAAKHPANKASFTFFYAFGKAGLDSVINATSKVAASTSNLSIKNVNAPAVINVYPNPATNTINVTGLNTGDQLELVDMMGRSAALNSGSPNQFSVSGFAPGNYILVVKDAEGNVKSRVEVRKQ